MLLKKVELTVLNKRSVTQFLNRNIEQFERKFDGFPATVEGDPQAMPAVQEGAVEGVDYSKIVDIISGNFIDTETPECGDVPAGSAVPGNSVTEALEQVGVYEFQPSNAVDYYVEVKLDGLMMVRGEDYTLTDAMNVLFVATIDTTDVTVQARYVVGAG